MENEEGRSSDQLSLIETIGFFGTKSLHILSYQEMKV
jgi:hypothetical protein